MIIMMIMSISFKIIWENELFSIYIVYIMTKVCHMIMSVYFTILYILYEVKRTTYVYLEIGYSTHVS